MLSDMLLIVACYELLRIVAVTNCRCYELSPLRILACYELSHYVIRISGLSITLNINSYFTTCEEQLFYMILVIVPERRKVFQYSFQAGFLILERITHKYSL